MDIEIEIDFETSQPTSRWIGDASLLARLSNCESLPKPPGVASALIELSNDPAADLAQLAEAVCVDEDLSQKIISICNSPTYSRARKIDNLRQALGLLGLNQTLNLAMSVSVLASVRDNQRTRIDPQLFWRRSLSRAVAAKLLAASAGVRDAESYFLCALLGDSGMLVFDQLDPELYEGAGSALNNHQRAIWLERKRYPIDHGVVGAWLLETWGMPEMYQFAAAHSHADHVEHPAWASVVSTMQMACSVADLFCRKPDSIDAADLLTKTLPKEALTSLVEHMAADIQDTCTLFDLALWSDDQVQAVVDGLPTQLDQTGVSSSRIIGDLVEPAEVSPKFDIDAATGLISAAHAREIIRDEVSMATRGNWPLGVIVVSFTDMQSVVRDAGQLVAQQISQIAASTMKRVFRETDVLCRKGEFELIAVLPGNNYEGSCIAKDRLSDALACVSQHEQMKRAALAIETFTFDGTSQSETDFFVRIFPSKKHEKNT